MFRQVVGPLFFCILVEFNFASMLLKYFCLNVDYSDDWDLW